MNKRVITIYTFPGLFLISYVGFYAFFNQEGIIGIFLPLFLLAIPFYISSLLYTLPTSLVAALMAFKSYKAAKKEDSYWWHYMISSALILIVSVAYMVSIYWFGYVISA